jgi:hypothetical protein
MDLLKLYVWQQPRTGQYYVSDKRHDHLNPVEVIEFEPVKALLIELKNHLYSPVPDDLIKRINEIIL